MLDLNECLEVGVSTQFNRLNGLVTLSAVKVNWKTVERYRRGKALKPVVDLDTIYIAGGERQVIDLLVKIISSLMDDEEAWSLFEERIRRMYMDTGEDKWLRVIPYRPHDEEVNSLD
jgi:hypothetical protein